jgi:ribosomal-protein-serine acetyltransferase
VFSARLFDRKVQHNAWMQRSNSTITVRPFLASDADNFLQAVRSSLDSLCYWFPWCHPNYALANAQGWMAYCEASWAAGTEYPMGIFDNATGQVLGGTGLNHISRAYNFTNLGYWVSESQRGKGLATAAARMALDIGFNDLRFTRIEIFALPFNLASQQVAKKLGATSEGVARNRLHFQGKPCDAMAYALTPSDLAITAHHTPQ